MTQRGLDKLRREWQKRLRLQDWKISATIVGKGVISGDELGQCRFITEARQAIIEILDPAVCEEDEAAGEFALRQEVEDTLVHELLHCHFAPIHIHSKVLHLPEEQIIESLSGALVELKRLAHPKQRQKRSPGRPKVQAAGRRSKVS